MPLPSAQFDKGTLRAQYQSIRSAIGSECRAELNRAIQRSLLAVLPGLDPPRPFIALYRAIRGEVDVFPMAECLLTMGWRISVPTVSKTHSELRFVEVDQHTTWRQGAFGIAEPDLAMRETKSITVDECSVAVVPGVAFTQSGARLGYGGGYYDRWLAAASTTSLLRIGVAYEVQIADHLSVDGWDQAVHLVVTDQTIYDCRRQPDGSANGDAVTGR